MVYEGKEAPVITVIKSESVTSARYIRTGGIPEGTFDNSIPQLPMLEKGIEINLEPNKLMHPKKDKDEPYKKGQLLNFSSILETKNGEMSDESISIV